MIINSANLRSSFVSFSTAYQGGFQGVQPMWDLVAMEVPSTTRSQEYGWLGDMPNIREWIGERFIQNLNSYGYVIRNRRWELTIGISRDDYEDDNLGVFAPMFGNMGQRTRQFPDRLLWPMLPAGFVTPCYDGQYFFDVDHPVIDENGVEQSVSNFGGGSGAPWYLMDSKQGFKPLIFQNRRSFEFTSMTSLTDEAVFSKGDFRFGVDGRNNAGYGMWQTCFASRQPLNPDTYQALREAMMGLKGNFGVPLGLVPDTLIVPPNMDRLGRKIVMNDRTDAGATNEYQGSATLKVIPWLA